MQTTVCSQFTILPSLVLCQHEYLLSPALDGQGETTAVTEDDSFIRKSTIISSQQLSTQSPQQKTEQINFEFSEDYRENDIREGTFWSQCSIDLIGRKPDNEPRVALFCMYQSRQQV